MKKFQQQAHRFAIFVTLAVTLHGHAQTISPMEKTAALRSVAEEAYIYGLPMVMNYAAMYNYAVDHESPEFKAPFNQLYNATHVFTPQDKAVVSPNSDTPYSIAWLDLRAEPMVVTVPPVDNKRYYSVMLCDGKTYNFGIIGSIATHGEPGDYLVAGPDWQGVKPDSIHKLFRSGTQQSLVVFRTQLYQSNDMENVIAVQAGYRIQPLSAYLHQPPPRSAPSIDFPKVNAELIKKNFFAYLDFALQFAPANENEASIRAKLAAIGIGTGHFDEFQKLAAINGADLAAGMKDGDAMVDHAIANFGRKVNGWNLFLAGGGNRERFAGNWLERAAFVKIGIFGLDSSEAIYGLARTSKNGELLDTSHHRYTLTFGAQALPPANAFWSVTMYDARTQLLVENPIHRYLINSPMIPALNHNADGSITIYIQKDSPGADRESNWLPAPDGNLTLGLRAYGPGENIQNASWTPPPIVLVDQAPF